MPSPDSLAEQAAHNAERYWFADGFVNIFSGIYFFGLAVMVYFLLPSFNSRADRMRYWIGYFICVNVGALHRPIVRWLKKRVTYPRTGYAAPPSITAADSGFFAPALPTSTELEYRLNQEATRKWYLVFLAVVVAYFLWPKRWFCIPAGIILGYVWRRQQPSIRPSWVLPIACAVVGVVAAVLPIQNLHRMAIVIFFFGAIHLFDGLYKLLVYLRRNPVAQANT
jgi:hypothetical protein